MCPSDPHENIPVALYIRSSGFVPEDSHEFQLETLQDYASRKGLEAVRIFSDSRGGRAQFEYMMAEATGGNSAFKAILVSDLGRFAPTSGEFSESLSRLQGSGVSVVSLTESGE